MADKKYECRICGRPFEAKAEEKEPRCVHCGSKEVAPRQEKPDMPPSCRPKGRFT